MAYYSLEFKPLSVITKIPDAQTIFGAFCYQYKALFGEAELEAFLKNESSIQPIVLFSSMFYKNALPLPLDFQLIYPKNLSLKQTIKNKQIKKIKYLSKAVYLEYISDKEKFQNEFYNRFERHFKVINNEILAFYNEEFLDEKYLVLDHRTRNSMDEKNEKRLFRDTVYYCNEKLTFNIYINILNERYTENILKTFKSMNYVFFGGFKSIGYNLYQFLELNEINVFNDKKHNMLISKSLVDKSIDIENSFYQIAVINNKFNTQGDKVVRKQVATFTEGSIIETDKDFIGGLVLEKQNNKNTFQYYLGMLI